MNTVKTGMLLAAMTALFLGVGYLIAGPVGAVIALVVAVGINAMAWWNSDKMALGMHKARRVTRASAPELVGMVEDLARRADLPMPAVYVIDDPQPNAFATGRDPSNAAVAATTGIIKTLTSQQLAGVMAHELAHIKNRDTLIMTIAATVAGAITMLVNFAQMAMMFGGGRNRGPLGIIAMMLAIFLAPLAALLIQMMISRTREYSADRMGGEICGNPLWLASALEQISGGARVHEMETAERNPASAHLFIVNPLSGRRMDGLFTTHPATENRVAALREQARAMGIGAGSPARTDDRQWGPPRTRPQGPWS